MKKVDFDHGTITHNILQTAFPMLVAQVLNLLYSIVDRVYIGRIPGAGTEALGAVGLCFPVIILVTGFTNMFGLGGAPLFSMALGQGNREKAIDIQNTALRLLVLVGAGILLVGELLGDRILLLFGATTEELSLALPYLRIYLVGTIFIMVSTGMNAYINAQGFPVVGMISVTIGAASNLILDPLFIFPMQMGMRGAAIATVIGQLLTAALSLWYLFHMKAVRPEKLSFRLRRALVKRLLALGLTSFLSQISLVVSMAAVQNMCMKYGAMDEIFGQAAYAQIPLAVLGIVMKFFQVAISVAVGMAAGCIPIAGYNIGAKRNDRAKGLFTCLLVAEAAVGAVALLLVEFFPNRLIGIFGAGNESVYYAEFAVRCFRIYLCMMPLAMVNKGTFIYLQALGRAAESTALSLIREVVFGVLLPVVLPVFWGLNGLLYSFPAADVLTFAITLLVIRRTCRQLSAN